MTRRFRACLCLGMALLLAGLCPLHAGDESSPEEDVKALHKRYLAAVNKHDAKAGAACYALDADSIGATGNVSKGREAMEKGAAEAYAKNPGYKLTALSITDRVLGPDHVLSDGTFEVSADNLRPIQGRFLIVAVRRDGQWQYLCTRTMVPHMPAQGGK